MNQALAQLPPLIASHVLLSGAALLLALVIALPLAVAAARRPRLRAGVLGLASLVQTIPGLALLALFYPLLLAIDGLVGPIGLGVPALGFLPALLALGLYAVLPILRNGVAGLTGIDPAVSEAADGVGMTAGQKLRLVEAPLAAPVAMAGIRTAAVWTIGTATLSTTVGQPSLGDMIFAGLQTQNWTLVLVGCVAAAALALLADGLLGLIESGIARRSRRRIGVGLAALAAGLVLALAPAMGLGGPRATVTIGAKNFSEQYVLARLIGIRLREAGYEVAYREGLGSTVALAALSEGDIDVYVDYSGTLWTGPMGRADLLPQAETLAAIAAWLENESGARMLGPLGFENAYAFAVRADTAERLGLATLDDLAARAPSLTLGTDIEFLERSEWARVREAYGLAFRQTGIYQPTFMYRALESGRADAITAFSSDGRIAADALVVLADPRGAMPRYDAVLLVSPARARDDRFLAALAPLIGAIGVGTMREANYLVDRTADKRSPAEAARWLAERIENQ